MSAAAFLIIFDNQGMALIAAAAASVHEAPDGAGLQAQPAVELVKGEDGVYRPKE